MDTVRFLASSLSVRRLSLAGFVMLPFFDRFANCRIAVIGDLILDCYLHGDVSRISPEAPVPVVRSLSEQNVPGGAANVVANLATLGVVVDVVGLTGQDSARESLVELLHAHGEIDVRGIIAVAERPTTRKLRVLGAHQQIVRVDHEDTSPCNGVIEDRLLQASFDAVDRADAVILSDYGKGALSPRVLRRSSTDAMRRKRKSSSTLSGLIFQSIGAPRS